MNYQEGVLGRRNPRLRVGVVKQPDGNGRKFVPKAALPDFFKFNNPGILMHPSILTGISLPI
jgi:hypothetical protein